MSYRPEHSSGLVVPVSQRTAAVLLALLPPERAMWERIRRLPPDARQELLRTLDTMRAASRLRQAGSEHGRPEVSELSERASSKVPGFLPAAGTPSEELLSVNEVADLLELSSRRVRQLLGEQLLAGSKVGHAWAITRDSVDNYNDLRRAA